MTYFNIEQSPYSKNNEYCIRLKENGMKYFLPMKGSFSVLYARLMGLTYPDFLCMISARYGARIVGKNNLYPSIYFQTEQDAKNLAQELDKRLLYVLKTLREELK